MDKEFKKIFISNLLFILMPLVINAIAVFPNGYPPKYEPYSVELPSFAFTALFILFVAAINLLLAIAFFFSKDSKAKYYLLSAGIILLIGVGVCSLP
jgi:hypothetical protein